MLVELLGRPGAGKSTLADALAVRVAGSPADSRLRVVTNALHPLNVRGGSRTFSRRIRQAVACSLALVGAPRLAFLLYAMHIAARGTARLSHGAVLTFLLESKVFCDVTKANEPGVVVLEEGPVQWAFSLTIGGRVERSFDSIRRYFERVYRFADPAFFHLAAPAAVALQRVSDRDRAESAFFRGMPGAARDALARYPFERLVDLVEAATGARARTVDATRSTQEGLVDLLQFIAAAAGR